jgi:hemerythrin superfamily protein
MDALELLTADHNRVRGLFSRFEKAHESKNDERMSELASKIVTELEVHTTIEEEIFYPTIAGMNDDLREMVAEGNEEHHVAKTLIEELGGLEPGGEEWVAKMTVLIESVEHHAEEEEKEMFPAVRSASDADTRTRVAEQLEARKRELGAPTLADKIDLTKGELMDKAKDQDIPGRSSMSHDELAATVAP